MKAWINLALLEIVILINIEPIRLDIYWSLHCHKEFKNEQAYDFLRRLNNLLLINADMLEEYVQNYNPEDGSSVISGQIIRIDAVVLQKVLYLSIYKILVGDEVSTDFKLGSYFKIGEHIFEKNQG